MFLHRSGLATDPQSWAIVVERWRALGRPHLVAYARYRQAGALLAARGSRSAAAEALRSARRIADDLGAAPLAREIAILAGHARIDLTQGGVEQPPDEATDPVRSLELTPTGSDWSPRARRTSP